MPRQLLTDISVQTEGNVLIGTAVANRGLMVINNSPVPVFVRITGPSNVDVDFNTKNRNNNGYYTFDAFEGHTIYNVPIGGYRLHAKGVHTTNAYDAYHDNLPTTDRQAEAAIWAGFVTNTTTS